MPRSRSDTLSNHLEFLLETSSGLDALALVNMDGREIASALLQGVNRERMSAMALALFSLGQQIATEFERGRLEEVYIRGRHGFIILMPFSDQAMLLALAREGARPGLVILELRHIVVKLLAPNSGLS
ncbi:MAG: roadblock/LC7 domain-containing protein [Anaerolineales bacterium]